jgi:phage terminase large subunit-like protein
MGRPIRQETLIHRGVVRSRLPVEAAVLGRVLTFQRRAIERKAYTAREQWVSRGDKATRAQSFRGRMAMLGLYVPTRAPWYPALRAELLSFPAGKYDDPG